MHLILFDIDGTLLDAGGAGRLAIARTLTTFAGRSDALEGFSFAGRLDWAIWRALLATEGYGEAEVDAQLAEIYRHYVAELAYVLADPGGPLVRPMPGVPALLARFAERDDVLLGLVTGNVEAGAWLKLARAGLQPFFRFGAFGDEAITREELPALALARARAMLNGTPLDPSRVTLIGDTPSDIVAARPLGARAVGVATGPFPEAALYEVGADVVFPDFRATEAVLSTLVAE